MTAMKKGPTYTHEDLVQLRQEGVISDLDFIQMHPDEQLREDYESFCDSEGREQDEDSATAFLSKLESDLEEGMLRGNA